MEEMGLPSPLSSLDWSQLDPSNNTCSRPRLQEILLPWSYLQEEVQLIHTLVEFALNELVRPGLDIGVAEM